MCMHACVNVFVRLFVQACVVWLCVGGDVSNIVTLEYCVCCASIFPKGYAVSYFR